VVFAVNVNNMRATALLINLQDNPGLDNQGWPPIGTVIQGLDIADQIYSGYEFQPQEDLIYSTGNNYLRSNFPNLDYVTKATLVRQS
jgi:peptidyl-prolyl cis-trans isomerase A (cyclophilin A)